MIARIGLTAIVAEIANPPSDCPGMLGSSSNRIASAVTDVTTLPMATIRRITRSQFGMTGACAGFAADAVMET